MGYGIARSLLRAGHHIHGHDINPQLVDEFQAEGGSRESPGNIVKTIDAAVIVVLNAAQTEAILCGEAGLVNTMKPGSVVISCATVSPEFAQRMEERCSERNIHYLDAPISGGSAKADTGQLSVMAAGSHEAFKAAGFALDAIAETVFKLGDQAGPGSAMKAVNQMLAGTHIAIMAEAMTFAISQGISPEKFLEVIPQCAGTSWMLENRAPHIVNGDYAPRSSVNIWPKDLGIVLDVARSTNFSAPVTAAALQQFLAAAGSGLGAEDDAAVAKVYARNAGLQLPEEK